MGMKNTRRSQIILSLPLRKSLRKISIKTYKGKKRIGINITSIRNHSPTLENEKSNPLFILFYFVNNKSLKY